ncbi:hypothetical protein RJ640_015818 [Escallonia rubra]|uniref:4Fe-4S ferredoxin-type domain-containing protein n=1 Tax=Escallonia rubra TaxID=112253 RepID=A0AA88S4C8_9ASTE|nr:hypothetical protein RJ640_015818 [Escallonia rubra]
MIPWHGCKATPIASAPRTEDCVGCKRCESACPTDFLSVRVYLWHETTRSMGLLLHTVSSSMSTSLLQYQGLTCELACFYTYAQV